MRSEWMFYARRLRNVQRCGTLRVLSRETVAEHSYYVAIIALDLCEKIEKLREVKIDKQEVLLRCLFHDIEEGVVGDIPYPFKAVSKQFRDTVEDATNDVCKLFFNETAQVYRREAKEGRIGEIVTAADYIELAYYCVEEMLLGNRDVQILEIYETCVKICKKTWLKDVVLEYFEDMNEYLRNNGVSGQNERMVGDGSSS